MEEVTEEQQVAAVVEFQKRMWELSQVPMNRIEAFSVHAVEDKKSKNIYWSFSAAIKPA